jgi:type IX secretion system PorP/SprF family membrane protein
MKNLAILFLALTNALGIQAQQDEQMSLYMQNPLYYNPAYAGSRQSVSFVSLARFQWVGFSGSPMSQWFSVHSPVLNNNLGIGGHFVNDNIGSRNRTTAYADLSAGIQLNKKGARLAAGLSGGVDFLSFDFTNLQVTDVNDPYYGQRFSSTKPNIGAGLYYYSDRHYIGISSPRLFEAKIADASTLVTSLNKRHFFFAAGTVFDLNSVVKFKPSTMIKYTPEAPLTMDFNASFLMYDKMWLGAMYRFNESLGLSAIIKIKNCLQVGYGYDFPINGLRTYQSGSHEILLTYDFNFKKTIYNSPRYF